MRELITLGEDFTVKVPYNEMYWLGQIVIVLDRPGLTVSMMTGEIRDKGGTVVRVRLGK